MKLRSYLSSVNSTLSLDKVEHTLKFSSFLENGPKELENYSYDLFGLFKRESMTVLYIEEGKSFELKLKDCHIENDGYSYSYGFGEKASSMVVRFEFESKNALNLQIISAYRAFDIILNDGLPIIYIKPYRNSSKDIAI